MDKAQAMKMVRDQGALHWADHTGDIRQASKGLHLAKADGSVRVFERRWPFAITRAD